MGAKCIDTGLPCDFVSSSCNNRTQLCIAFGPGKDMVDSTRIIGDKQFQKAWVIFFFFENKRNIRNTYRILLLICNVFLIVGWQSMYNVDDSELEALEGPVQFAHQFVDRPNYTVEVQDPVNGPTTVRNNTERSLSQHFVYFFTVIIIRRSCANRPWATASQLELPTDRELSISHRERLLAMIFGTLWVS